MQSAGRTTAAWRRPYINLITPALLPRARPPKTRVRRDNAGSIQTAADSRAQGTTSQAGRTSLILSDRLWAAWAAYTIRILGLNLDQWFPTFFVQGPIIYFWRAWGPQSQFFTFPPFLSPLLPSPLTARGLGERCKLPQQRSSSGVWGGAPADNAF